MKTKILDQIRGSEQGMLQLLEELVNIDSGADALAGMYKCGGTENRSVLRSAGIYCRISGN